MKKKVFTILSPLCVLLLFISRISAAPVCVSPGNLGDGSLSVTGTGWKVSSTTLISNQNLTTLNGGNPVALRAFFDLQFTAQVAPNDWSKYYVKFQFVDNTNNRKINCVFTEGNLGGWHGIPAQIWQRISLEAENVPGFQSNSPQGRESWYCTVGGCTDFGTGDCSNGRYTIYPTDEIYYVQLVANPNNGTFTLYAYGNGNGGNQPPPNSLNSTPGNKWFTIGTIQLVNATDFDFTNVSCKVELWASTQAQPTDESTIYWYAAHLGVPLNIATEDPIPTVVWVDDDFAGGKPPVTPGWGVTRFNKIQDGINAVCGSTVFVGDGTYYENILINKNITLKSINGYNSTTIIGSAGSSLGTIQVSGVTNGVQIGDLNHGFTIVGFDGPPGLEKACIYFQGPHTNPKVIGNKIVANGEAGLLTEYGHNVNNLSVENNIFTGKTFMGDYPAGDGFSAQFTLLNVPRQLVTISTGTQNASFFNNIVEGITGGCSNTDNSGNPTNWHQQGNTQVTIDATNATIMNNTFKGITSRYAHALRARGTGTVTISNNLFDGYNPYHFFANISNTGRALAVLNNNTFTDPSPTIYQESIISSHFNSNPLNCGCNEAAVDDDWVGLPSGKLVFALNKGWIIGLNAFSAIQDGIDAVCNSTVYVLPGTYVQQITVNNKNINLIGSGKATTFIHAPNSLSNTFTTSLNHYCVVGAINNSILNISGFTIDGLSKGNGHYRFVGVGYRNSAGSVEDCEIKNIQENPFNGNQHGVAVYMYNNDGNTRNFNLKGSTLKDFQKNGCAIVSDDVLTLNISDNKVFGKGPTGIIAQNGIQTFGSKIQGTVSNNEVNGIEWLWPGTGTQWVATSILNYYADLDIIGNKVTNGHVGIYNIDAPVRIKENTLNIYKNGADGIGVAFADPPMAIPSPFEEEISETIKKEQEEIQSTTTTIAKVELYNNKIVFQGPGSYVNTIGIAGWAGYGPYDIDFIGKYNLVVNFDYGVYFAQNPNASSPKFNSIIFNLNSVYANKSYGCFSALNYLTADARFNWWGDCTGPLDNKNLPGVPDYNNTSGLGNKVSSYVDYKPWLGGSFTGLSSILHLNSAAYYYNGPPSGTPVQYWHNNWCPQDMLAVSPSPNRYPKYMLASPPMVEFKTNLLTSGNNWGSSDVMQVNYDGNITSNQSNIMAPDNTQKTLFVAFKPESDNNNSRQVIFEAGSTTSGYNLYTDNDKLVFGMWNRLERRYVLLASQLTMGEYYLAQMEFDGNNFRAYLNGNHQSPTLGFSGLTKDPFDASGQPSIGIAGEVNGTRFHDYNIRTFNYSHTYNGGIGDILLFNNILTADQKAEIYDYFNAKYGKSWTAPAGNEKRGDWYVFSENENFNNLSEAYPNPFTHSTQFAVNLEAEQNVHIELYNSIGELVSVIYSGKLPKGMTVFTIDGSKLTPGMYAYRIITDGFVQSGKVILVK